MLKREWKVLLVDDDPDDYRLVQDALEETGSQVDWIADFDSALEELPENRYHAYLVDYRLGAHDGLELIREGRARGCQSPIILLTGYGDLLVDVRAMEAGASDYLEKGQVDATLLERSIRYAVEQNRAQAALARQAQELAQEFADVVSRDLQEPLRLLTESLARMDKRFQAPGDADARNDLMQAREAAAKITEIIEELEAMSRAAAEE